MGCLMTKLQIFGLLVDLVAVEEIESKYKAFLLSGVLMNNHKDNHKALVGWDDVCLSKQLLR
ncbi:hypothetical protein AKJ16_DCAP11004 [Drosera capensis]